MQGPCGAALDLQTSCRYTQAEAPNKKTGVRDRTTPGHTGIPTDWGDYTVELTELKVPAIQRRSITSEIVPDTGRAPHNPRIRKKGLPDHKIAVRLSLY
jgi:hypothetical protein